MVTETFCTPIDPWRAHAIGMYPFVACVALVLRIFAVCRDDLRSEKVFSLGERDETMARITLFLLLFWCIVGFVIII